LRMPKVRIHPVSTAGMVLAAIFAVFAFLEELLEVFDAVAGKGGRRLIAGPPDGEAPVFRLHLQGDFFQLVNILAEHFGDAVDGEEKLGAAMIRRLG
jgi:hypothetical protein